MNTLKTLALADFEQFNPSYNLKECYGKFSGTILDILKDERIPSLHRIWAFTRKGIVDTSVLQKFAIRCAKEIQHLMEEPRSIKAIEVAERYINGESTREELEEARLAARAAVWAAAAWVTQVKIAIEVTKEFYNQ